MLSIAQFFRRFSHNCVHGELEEEIEFLNFFMFLNGVFHKRLSDCAGHLTMFFSPLPQLLPLDGVTRSRNIRSWLLREDVLNGQNFVEKLKLLLGSLSIRLTHQCSIVLCTVNSEPNGSQIGVKTYEKILLRNPTTTKGSI